MRPEITVYSTFFFTDFKVAKDNKGKTAKDVKTKITSLHFCPKFCPKFVRKTSKKKRAKRLNHLNVTKHVSDNETKCYVSIFSFVYVGGYLL